MAKRFQIRRTVWQTVAEFDTLEEAQAHWDASETEDPVFPQEMGKLVDTQPERPQEVVIDSYA